jgi:hypothetical protein
MIKLNKKSQEQPIGDYNEEYIVQTIVKIHSNVPEKSRDDSIISMAISQKRWTIIDVASRRDNVTGDLYEESDEVEK